jgi:hypothetical protein
MSQKLHAKTDFVCTSAMGFEVFLDDHSQQDSPAIFSIGISTLLIAHEYHGFGLLNLASTQVLV